MSVVVVEHLRKSYGDVRAIDDVSFCIERGEIYGLLGPNGAGKTSTIEILEGYRAYDSGAVSVLGHDPADASRDFRARIGIVLQTGALEEGLRVREVLAHYAALYPRARVPREVLDIVGLDGKEHARVGQLSGGQRRRLELALGIIGDPELIFLDEPTTGFDPEARRQAWDLVRRLADLGKTILLTTHYMDEAYHLADRVAVLSAGRIVIEGRPDALGGPSAGRTVVSFRLNNGLGPADLPVPVRNQARMRGDRIEVETATPTEALRHLTQWAIVHGGELADLTVVRPSLEEVYLRIVQEAEGGDDGGRDV